MVPANFVYIVVCDYLAGYSKKIVQQNEANVKKSNPQLL